MMSSTELNFWNTEKKVNENLNIFCVGGLKHRIRCFIFLREDVNSIFFFLNCEAMSESVKKIKKRNWKDSSWKMSGKNVIMGE